MVTMEAPLNKKLELFTITVGAFLFSRMEESLQDLRATIWCGMHFPNDLHLSTAFIHSGNHAFSAEQQALASFFHFSAEIGSNSPQVLP